MLLLKNNNNNEINRKDLEWMKDFNILLGEGKWMKVLWRRYNEKARGKAVCKRGLQGVREEILPEETQGVSYPETVRLLEAGSPVLITRQRSQRDFL